MVQYIIWDVTFALVCIFAFARGGWPERVTTFVLIIADGLSFIKWHGAHQKRMEPMLFFIDLCVAAFFVLLALKSSRWWPLWAAAFNIMAFIMLVVSASDPTIRPYAYYVGEITWDYFVLAALFWGTMFEGRRDIRGPSPPQANRA
jgi:hypothetical protein